MSQSQFEPGDRASLDYRGASNSKLLLLAVDQAVYALGGTNLLTAKKVRGHWGIVEITSKDISVYNDNRRIGLMKVTQGATTRR